jgi:hypothetical protein
MAIKAWCELLGSLYGVAEIREQFIILSWTATVATQ